MAIVASLTTNSICTHTRACVNMWGISNPDSASSAAEPPQARCPANSHQHVAGRAGSWERGLTACTSNPGIQFQNASLPPCKGAGAAADPRHPHHLGARASLGTCSSEERASGSPRHLARLAEKKEETKKPGEKKSKRGAGAAAAFGGRGGLLFGTTKRMMARMLAAARARARVLANARKEPPDAPTTPNLDAKHKRAAHGAIAA